MSSEEYSLFIKACGGVLNWSARKNWGKAIEIIRAHPSVAKESGECENLPLHRALKNAAPTEVIDALLKAYPDAARKRNMHGYLPLHFAVLYLAPPAVISSLLDVYPEACLAKDRDNNIALHWAAAMVHTPRKVIDLLLHTYKDLESKSARADANAGVDENRAAMDGLSVATPSDNTNEEEEGQ